MKEAAVKELQSSGVFIKRNFRSEDEINEIFNELKFIENTYYNEINVKRKLFRTRETHEFRKGDACMVTNGHPVTEPCLFVNSYVYETITELVNTYNNIIGECLNEDMSDSKLLMNWQEYYEGGDNSLPQHMDVELINGDWGKYKIDINVGLLPRYVMVLVTENQNSGGGLKAVVDGVEIDLNLDAGDLIIFDNTKILHGVPESTPKNRKMLGFRSFETKPLYFSKEEFEDSEPFKNEFYSGYSKELSTVEAINILLEASWYTND